MKIFWYSFLMTIGIISLLSCIALLIGETPAVGWFPQSAYYPWGQLLWAFGAMSAFYNGFTGVRNYRA